MAFVAHWDEVERERSELGPMASWTADLGTAAGSVSVGVTRWEVDPDKRSTPAHMELVEEEISYVLGGSGLSWQFDGETTAAYEVREGDCLVHLACETVHTLRAGPDGLDVLAFGQRAYPGGTWLPRAGVVRMPPTWVETPGDEHPWAREAAAGEIEFPKPSERPPTIVNLEDVEQEEEPSPPGFEGTWRELGRAAGSLRTGLNYVEVEPGNLGTPYHCHSAEEEIFIVLRGEGTLLLGEERIPVRNGHVVARPPGTRVAHAFEAGDDGLTYLAYGTREPNDIAYYPRSKKIYWRGVGVMARVEKLDYWDGEV
jgi:uncharacterized cupin superfamily protein